MGGRGLRVLDGFPGGECLPNPAGWSATSERIGKLPARIPSRQSAPPAQPLAPEKPLLFVAGNEPFTKRVPKGPFTQALQVQRFFQSTHLLLPFLLQMRLLMLRFARPIRL